MIILSESCRIDLEDIIYIILDEFRHRGGIEQVDVSMFSEDTQKEILNALGERYWQKESLGHRDSEKAISFFTRSNNQERLMQIGNELLSELQIEWAEKAFRAAGKKVTTTQYNTMADIRTRRGDFYGAIELYSKAGNKRALMKLRELCIEGGHLGWAECTFKVAGEKMTKAQYKRIGDICLQNGNQWNALSAYKKASCRAGMCKVGDIFIEQGDLENARKAYKMARRKLELTPEQYCKVGDVNLRKKQYKQAIQAYESAGEEDKILKMAQTFVERGDLFDFSYANLAYRVAGKTFPKEQALHIAEKRFRDRDMGTAYKAYKFAGDDVMASFTEQFLSKEDQIENI